VFCHNWVPVIHTSGGHLILVTALAPFTGLDYRVNYNCQICIYTHTRTHVKFQNKCYTYPGLTWCIAICIRLLFINNLMHTYGIFVVIYVCVWICMLCYAYLNFRVLSFVRVEQYAYALNFFNFWCFGVPTYTSWTLNDRNVSFCGCCVIVTFHSPCSDELWWSLVC